MSTPHRLARRASIHGRTADASTGAPAISVVTEDAALAETCARILAEAGYGVRTGVHSGHAMLACLQGHRTDVLICELAMQEGSGPALARRLQRYNPKLQAIYIAREGMLCDAENVLVRPFTREDLLARVARLTSS
jgi:DNA-binding NtrC family response regulator